MRKFSLLNIFFTLIICGSVSFGQIHTDNFDYPQGDSLINHGWVNHSGTGTQIVVTPGSLFFLGYSASGFGNSTTVLGGSGSREDIHFSGTSSVNTSGAYYLGVLVNVDTAAATGGYFLHFSENPHSTAFRGRVFVQDNGAGGFFFGLSKASTSSVNYTSTSYTYGETYLLVLKYEYLSVTTDDDVVSLFINPDLSQPEPAADLTNGDVGSDIAIGSIDLRQGGEAYTVQVDGIIFGTDFSLTAQNFDVTFNVDMGAQVFKGNFNAATGKIVVRGSFQKAAGDTADWAGDFFAMTDPDADTVYSVTATFPDSLFGTFYEYKFVMDGDFEGGANKNFTLTGPSMNLPTFWFNNDSSYFIATPVTNTIEFTADIGGIIGIGAGGAFDVAQDSLTVAGLDWDQLGKDVVGNRTLQQDQFTPGIFRTTLTFTSGAATIGEGDSTKWKFKAEVGSRFSGDGWESGADRWHVYTADGVTTVLPTIVPRITPLFGPLTADVQVTFNVDLTGAKNRYNGELIPLDQVEFVGMRGGADFLGTWVTGGNWTPSDTVGGVNMKVLQNAGSNIWTRTTTVAAGTNAGFYEYKYAAMYPGADTINGGSSPLDHEGGFGSNHSFTLLDGPAIVLNNVFGDFSVTDVERVNDIIPAAYQLEQNYPNPFNPATKIRYNIPEAGLVTLKVYNLLGQEVATLVNNEQVGGVYEVNFDAASLSSGIYFYTLDAKNFTSTKKMILLK